MSRKPKLDKEELVNAYECPDNEALKDIIEGKREIIVKGDHLLITAKKEPIKFPILEK